MTQKPKNKLKVLTDEINAVGKKHGKTVTLRTIQNWSAAGAPIDDRKQLVIWLLTRQRLPRAVAMWIKEQQPPPKKRTRTKKSKSSNDGSLEDLRESFLSELNEAKNTDDLDSVKYWTDRFVQVDKAIRENEAHNKKLGLDRGEVLPRAEVERLLRAVAYAGNACIAGTLKEICERIITLKTPEDAYHFLKPVLLGGRLFAGFKKVEKISGEPNVPDWLSKAIREESELYLKNPEIIWDEKAS